MTRHRRARALFAALALAAPAAAVSGPATSSAPKRPPAVVVRGATIWTQGQQGRLDNADLLVRDGRVEKVGRGLTVPAGAVVIDGSGKHVTPGLVDCHSHTAIRGGVNEGSNNVTAEVRILDVIDPTDVNIYRGLAGGLTTSNLLHGSANSIGGQNAVVKMRWRSSIDAMLAPEATPGIKFALGENPKRSNFRAPGGADRYPATRMGVMESIRERFLAARDYVRDQEVYDRLPKKEQERREPPRRNLQLEALAEVLQGKRLVHAHAYRQDEMLALMRVAEEFGFRVQTFQHVLEGYKIADEIAAHGAGASTFSDWWAFKIEAWDAIPYNGALMRGRGVSVSFNSDSSELARRLNLEAAKAVKYGGVRETDALGFVTLEPARQLGLGDRIGSLEPGKDADFVVWSGDPLSVYSVAEQTWIEGALEFDRAADLAGREAAAQERADLIQRIAGNAPTPPPATKTPSRPHPAQAAPQYLDRLSGLSTAVSIVNAVVHTVSGETIPNGTVSFRGGRIVDVAAGARPAPGAEVVDAAGKHLYPGLVDASTGIGLVEIGSVAGSVDLAETGGINPEINTAIAVNPDSELIPAARANGITHVLTTPEGGLVSGTSALIRLDGWTWEDLRAASPVAMHAQWPSFAVRRASAFGPPPPSEEDQRKEREEALNRIRRLFEDARAYARAKDAVSRGGRPFDVDAGLEAMLPVLDGRTPVVVHASDPRQVRSAVDWSEREGVRLIVAGSPDLWRSADLLAAHDVPVVLESVLSLPAREDDPYDAAYAAAARLHAAGVRFCISSGGGSFGSSSVRNLPYHAGMAAAFGLPREEALRSVTLYPARILGLDRDLGSIEVGKSASLVLTDGDPIEIRTRVVAEWIDGRPVDLQAGKQWRLYKRYEGRPAAPARAAR